MVQWIGYNFAKVKAQVRFLAGVPLIGLDQEIEKVTELIFQRAFEPNGASKVKYLQAYRDKLIEVRDSIRAKEQSLTIRPAFTRVAIYGRFV